MFKKACVVAALAAVSLGAVVTAASAQSRTVSNNSYYSYSNSDQGYPNSNFTDNSNVQYGSDGSAEGWKRDF